MTILPKRKKIIAIVGSSGFLGSNLLKYLKFDYDILSISRNKPVDPLIKWLRTESLFTSEGQTEFLNLSPNYIIHTASIAHSKYKADHKSKLYTYKINIKLTEILSELAIKSNINKLIYISTAGVHGAFSPKDGFISEASPIKITNLYTHSKFQAELTLIKSLKFSNIPFVIVRPSLIYGPGMKGNLLKLKSFVSNYPSYLPFEGNTSSRSLLGVRNFCSAISLILTSSSVDGRVFLLSDNENIQISSLFSLAYASSLKSPALFNGSFFLKHFLKNPIINSKLYSQFFQDLVISNGLFRNETGWEQPFNQTVGLIESFMS